MLRYFCIVSCILFSMPAFSVGNFYDNIWSESSVEGLFRLDINNLQKTLAMAPTEHSGKSGVKLPLPLPGGQYIVVSVMDSPVLPSALAVKFPEIKTYVVQGIEDPTITGRLDFTPKGFHGILSTSEGKVYVAPEQGAVLSSNTYRSSWGSATGALHCATDGVHIAGSSLLDADKNVASLPELTLAAPIAAGGDFRTYRLAVITTAAYTRAASADPDNPTIAEGLAAVTTVVNRVNEVFQRDLAVKFELVADNDRLIMTTSSTDWGDGFDADTVLGAVQAKIEGIIDTSDYDIGHAFTTNSGGLANVRGVCYSLAKARGTSGTSGNPISEQFSVVTVAHELGHQMGALHTFNADAGTCSGNRSASSAYEPGSGMTIMSYAGSFCSSQLLAIYGDAVFHSYSQEVIRNNIDNGNGGVCGTTSPTASTPPVADAGSNYTIPANTPFVLTGAGTDVNPADVPSMTYSWEQLDLGLGTTTKPEMLSDMGSGPLFRTFMPGSSPMRYFPRLSRIQAGNISPSNGETLPTTTRDINFRLTVRSGLGTRAGFDQEDMLVSVDSGAGPFVVNTPLSGVAVKGGEPVVVTWDTANTENPPVSCSAVSISYSSDGGVSFSTVLADTVNDGSEAITVPNASTDSGRIKVQCDNNIFFAFSPGDFLVSEQGAVSINSGTPVQPEGDSGNSAYTFTVTRTGITTGNASVDYILTGDADAADFGGTLPSGTVVFGLSNASEAVIINVSGDIVGESDESFTLTLVNPVGLVIATATALATIQNDDTSIGIFADTLLVTEGNGGSTSVDFTVSRTGDSSVASSVDYTVVGSGNHRVDAVDFGGVLPSGTVDFITGEISKVITVNVTGDNTVEQDEEFTVQLSNSVGGRISTASASSVITNDDVKAVTKKSGGGGAFGWVIFYLLLPFSLKILMYKIRGG